MDHKEYFERYGHLLVAHTYAATAEQLYQAIKQRLIEEVVPLIGRQETPIGFIENRGKLIDTTTEVEHER